MIFGNKAKRKNVQTEALTDVKQPAQKDNVVTRVVDDVRKIKLIFTVISTLFFIANSLFWVFNKWGDFGNLLWVMLGVTLAYVVVFVITIVRHRKDSAQMSVDNQKFKMRIKFMHALTNLLFIVMSALTLAQNYVAWQDNGNLLGFISMLFSGFVLVVKLISPLLNIRKLNKKRKKLQKQQRKYDNERGIANR